MAKRRSVEKIMRRLGAVPRGKVRAEAGAWGAARLADEITLRFRTPTSGGRPTEPAWSKRRLVPLAPATLARLSTLAARVRRGRPGISIEPMQLAGLLLEESTRNLSERSAAKIIARHGA